MDVIAATMGNMMRERDEQMVTLLTGRADLSAEQLKTAFREVTPECTPRLNAQ
jgi:hypothetical protein